MKTLDQFEFRFDGATLRPELDHKRLSGQLSRVWTLCRDGRWRTLGEIASTTGSPESSVSARLRDLRKMRFGGHLVDRRHRGEPGSGLYEYRVIPNPRTEGRLEELFRAQRAPF